MRVRPTDQTTLMALAYQAWMPSQTSRWYKVGERYAITRDAMRMSAQLVENAAYGADFRDEMLERGARVQGGGTEPLAWALRHVELANGHWCVAGINYMKLDPDKPFVQVIITSHPPELPALEGVAAALHQEFAAFSPLAIRFNMPNPPAEADVDVYAVAGLVDDLRAHPRVPRYGAVSLHPADPEEAERFARQVPQADPPPLDQLVSCAEEGYLFFADIAGSRAGLAAARRDVNFGGRGFEVIAHMLAPAARGSGYAPAMMQHLVDALVSQPTDTLWGTIDPRNTAALRTAAAVGREAIGAQVWVARRAAL